MRVLILSTRYPDAGNPNAGNFVEREARALAALPGVEIRVVAPSRAAPIVKEEVWHGLRTHRPAVPGLLGPQERRPNALARSILPLARAMRAAFPFDLLCADFAWPEGPAAAAIGCALGVPVMIKARGMDFERRLAPAAVRRRLLRAMRAAAGLVAVSGDLRETMVAAGVPREKITVIHAGVDAGRFALRDRRATKAAFGIQGPLLLCVGNLIPIKGQDLAIEALAGLPGVQLFIVGDGPERDALESQARSLDVAERVRFFGSLPNALLPSFYAAADAIVHASRMEGFPNVRLEALASGTPLVTTAVGDAAAVMRTTAAGRIVAPDPRAIAAAVRTLLADPPSPQAVRENVLDFTWERTAERLYALCASIVGAA